MRVAKVLDPASNAVSYTVVGVTGVVEPAEPSAMGQRLQRHGRKRRPCRGQPAPFPPHAGHKTDQPRRPAGGRTPDPGPGFTPNPGVGKETLKSIYNGCLRVVIPVRFACSTPPISAATSATRPDTISGSASQSWYTNASSTATRWATALLTTAEG
jgi:hypothetical protein